MFCRWIFLSLIIGIYAEEMIEVEKNGVLHRFVPCDARTDGFARHSFAGWESETFDVFEQVKDNQTIAIDLGAWIATTSIWLSNHFYHVIAVEPDRESLECLKKNLTASECDNVTVCEHPVSHRAQEVIFGPRGNYLNESVSFVKPKIDNVNDYVVQSITLNELISQYVEQDPALYCKKVGFIKCDIEGGEEDILEDLLNFSLSTRCKVYISFHVSWWRSKNIGDFAPLFRRFRTDCGATDLAEYIRLRPFISILFEPLPF